MSEGRKKVLPLVYSCSGCSSAAQMANALAIRMDREGKAEMSCIAGVGGGVSSLVRVARSGRPIIALDGCPLHCVKMCLAQQGVSANWHRTLSDFGVKKRLHADFDFKECEAVYAQILGGLEGAKISGSGESHVSSGGVHTDLESLSEKEVTIRIYPANEGPIAALAKVPVLGAKHFDLQIKEIRQIRFELRVEDIVVMESPHISREDQKKIEDLVHGKLLTFDRYPLIRFEGELELRTGENAADVSGTLLLRGVEQPCAFDLRRNLDHDPDLWTGEWKIKQSAFGIQPFSAFMGQLRSKDEIRVHIEVRLP